MASGLERSSERSPSKNSSQEGTRLFQQGCHYSKHDWTRSSGSAVIPSLIFPILHHLVSSSTTISQVPVAPTTELFTIVWTHPALSHGCDCYSYSVWNVLFILPLLIDSIHSLTTSKNTPFPMNPFPVPQINGLLSSHTSWYFTFRGC